MHQVGVAVFVIVIVSPVTKECVYTRTCAIMSNNNNFHQSTKHK